MSDTPAKKPWTEADEVLKFKVLDGFKTRGLPMTQPYLDRIEHEGQIIFQMTYAPYFLIVADLCRFMREKGIRFVVRGSGCGSCYVWGLHISHRWLDPVQYKLPFERFLNPSRVSMPDLDIDIDDSRRHEVVEYTVQKYGKERVARIITFGTLGAKAAINDVARALELPNYQEVCAKISDAIPAGKIKLADAIKDSELLREFAGAYPQLFAMAQRCEGKARHAGVHAAGVIIAPEVMTKYVPLYFDGKPEAREAGDWEPATQWDMYDVEERGMLKMDFLGLKTLRVIDQTVRWINASRQFELNLPPDFDIDTVDRFDDRAWKMLADGKLAGVFQVERTFIRNFARQMNLMAKDPWRLAVLISIIRPGMMDAGTTEVYLKRAQGLEAPVPIHPKLEKTLKENFGLLVFQEDCMWVARDLAGFTLAEADNLRRAIAKKKPKDMAKIHPFFIKGCVEHSKITEKEAEDVWSQMVTFARYGFNNAHAAAYGMVVAYQTAFLKTVYPLHYMANLINSESGVGDKEVGYNAKVAEYVEDARSMGITVKPACVKESGPFCTINIKKNTIRFGLEMIKRVGSSAIQWIMQHRGAANSFREFVCSCHELVETPVKKPGVDTGEKLWKPRSRVGKTDLEMLIKAGAFDVFDQDRDKLMAMLPGLMELADDYWKQAGKVKSGKTKGMKKTPGAIKALIDAYQVDEGGIQHQNLEARLEDERACTGCYLSDSPFAPYRATIKQYETCTSEDVRNNEYDGTGVFAGLLRDFRTTIIKNGKKRGAEMAFLTFTGYSTDVEVVAFSDTWSEVKSQTGPDGKPIPFERGKVYMVAVRPDRSGKSAVLDRVVRLSNSVYAAA